MFRNLKHLLSFALTGVVVLVSAGTLCAQGMSNSTGYSPGGSSGSSSSGFGLSSGSSSSGSSSGSFGLSSNIGIGGTTSTTSSNTNGPGSTSLYGPYLANPLATGITTQSSSSSSGSSTTIPFGNALYNVSSTSGSGSGSRTGSSRTGTSGTGNIKSGTSGTAQIYSNSSAAFKASSAGYVARIAFAVEKPAMAGIQTDLRQLLAQATELPSRQRISIELDGDVVVLKGQVTNPEERRLVESMVKFSPGVNKVRNELVPQSTEEQ